MFRNLIVNIMNLSIWVNLSGLGLSAVGFNWVQGKLNQSYAASNHPVDYATGQTSFNAETIQGYYAHMIEAGTLDVYWTTQLIDYGFMTGLFCIGLFISALIARFARGQSWARKIALLGGASIMFGAVSDAIENLISFYMLSMPTDFSQAIAILYSGFASLKFALIAFGMLGFAIAIVLMVLGRISGKKILG